MQSVDTCKEGTKGRYIGIKIMHKETKGRYKGHKVSTWNQDTRFWGKQRQIILGIKMAKGE